MRREKGSALITVILVVLVLTMVGLAALYYMTIEDTISGNDRYQKEALYLAEVGLRAGEARMAGIGVAQINSLLTYVNANNSPPPGSPIPLLTQATGYQYLGAVLTDAGNQPLYNISITYTTEGGPRTGHYSVYVRNNPNDTAGSWTDDRDGRVDVIASGVVTSPSGAIVAQKVLSEEFFLGSAQGSTLGPQKGGYSSGQNVQQF